MWEPYRLFGASGRSTRNFQFDSIKDLEEDGRVASIG